MFMATASPHFRLFDISFLSFFVFYIHFEVHAAVAADSFKFVEQ